MESIAELERRVGPKPQKASPEELHTLALHYWDLASHTQDYRARRKHLTRSCYFLGNAVAVGVDSLERLDLYRTILQSWDVGNGTAWDQGGSLVSKIIARRLELTGADKQEVLAKAKGRIQVDCGLISLGDRARCAPSEKDWHLDAQLVQRINNGERLTFSTGGDDIYPAEIRLIQAVEPVLTVNEYKKLASSTATVVIDVPSGALGMAEHVEFLDEPWDKKKIKGAACLDVPPGRYKACAYGFASSRCESVIAVVTATSDEPRNGTLSLDSLFG